MVFKQCFCQNLIRVNRDSEQRSTIPLFVSRSPPQTAGNPTPRSTHWSPASSVPYAALYARAPRLPLSRRSDLRAAHHRLRVNLRHRHRHRIYRRLRHRLRIVQHLPTSRRRRIFIAIDVRHRRLLNALPHSRRSRQRLDLARGRHGRTGGVNKFECVTV